MEPSILVISGNPVDGFLFTGPFDDSESAAEWAVNNTGRDWWLGSLDTPR